MPHYLLSVCHDEPYDDMDTSSPDIQRMFKQVDEFNAKLRKEGAWVFGAGLMGLAVAWIVTTGLAFAAVLRGQLHQHQEWMIRSYVVTFGFVFFRIFIGIAQATGIGTLQEQLTAASWFCWAAPLLATEAILQGRKIFAR